MKEQFIIEKEWPVAKLLVTNIDYKMIFFKLGMHGIYVQSLTPIPICYPSKPRHMPRNSVQYNFADAKMPHILTVRSKDPKAFARFIQSEPEFQASRIFKSGLYFNSLKKEHVIGLVCDTIKNMLCLKKFTLMPVRGLFSRAITFRIKSDNRALRNMFYEKAVEINESDKLGHYFDHDVYDYTLWIRAYKRFLDGEFHKWAVVTILYGKNLLNYWNMWG